MSIHGWVCFYEACAFRFFRSDVHLSHVSQTSLGERLRGSALCCEAMEWDSQVLAAEGTFLKPSHAHNALVLCPSPQWPHPEGLCCWSAGLSLHLGLPRCVVLVAAGSLGCDRPSWEHLWIHSLPLQPGLAQWTRQGCRYLTQNL